MIDSLRERLERASEGLVYSSESDRPFVFVRFAGVCEPAASLDLRRVAELAGAAGARVREWPSERLLRQKIAAVDPLDHQGLVFAGRYAALEDLLTRSLGPWRVFRVGTVDVRVLALGNDPSNGELAGLETVAIET